MRDKFVKPVEQFLIGLDNWPWNAASRVAIGLALPPVFHTLFGRYESAWWGLPMFFIAVLVALRVVPAVLRLALPFSAEAKAIWSQRRGLAKRYDSYQWQKLFWIGLGLLPHVLLAGAVHTGELAVAILCLVGGGLGLVMWQKINAAHAPSP